MSTALVESKALNTTLTTSRYIGRLEGNPSGPTVVFFGGIHGNEPSGVFALRTVTEKLKQHNVPLRGNFVALAGNLTALAEGKRFHAHDLNRLWTDKRMQAIRNGQITAGGPDQDTNEQLELLHEIDALTDAHSGPFYFFDLHTTSAPTPPFIFINDTLYNRRLATKYPAPVILGIEESIEGPLLSYINTLGYMAVGFEAGQHDAPESIHNHEAFIWCSLVHSGVVAASDVPELDRHQRLLRSHDAYKRNIYEIRHRCVVEPDDGFVMKPGYRNFQGVRAGELLAHNAKGEITSPSNGRIFMPLYQPQGEDGFFIIWGIHPFWLWLSTQARKLRLEGLLAMLPGIKRVEGKLHTLQVNPRTARWLAVDLFHLLGYRKKVQRGRNMIFTKREFDVAGVGKERYR